MIRTTEKGTRWEYKLRFARQITHVYAHCPTGIECLGWVCKHAFGYHFHIPGAYFESGHPAEGERGKWADAVDAVVKGAEDGIYLLGGAR